MVTVIVVHKYCRLKSFVKLFQWLVINANDIKVTSELVSGHLKSTFVTGLSTCKRPTVIYSVGIYST